MDKQNRDDFLASLASKMGREVNHVPSERPNPSDSHEKTRLTELSADERLDAFEAFATETMKVNCVRTTEKAAADAALALCEQYGGSPVVMTADDRLVELGITPLLAKSLSATVWDPEVGQENINAAERAKVGVVFAEAGLTESGGVVLFSSPERGRSVSLLPEASIFVVRKSMLLPRVAQMATRLHEMAQRGERMPSCINIIAGPSSTADIELIKVVGVHGPVHAAYLIIEDC